MNIHKKNKKPLSHEELKEKVNVMMKAVTKAEKLRKSSYVYSKRSKKTIKAKLKLQKYKHTAPSLWRPFSKKIETMMMTAQTLATAHVGVWLIFLSEELLLSEAAITPSPKKSKQTKSNQKKNTILIDLTPLLSKEEKES